VPVASITERTQHRDVWNDNSGLERAS
jgi:hypothetical protein